jgi:hypothetical protein
MQEKYKPHYLSDFWDVFGNIDAVGLGEAIPVAVPAESIGRDGDEESVVRVGFREPVDVEICDELCDEESLLPMGGGESVCPGKAAFVELGDVGDRLIPALLDGLVGTIVMPPVVPPLPRNCMRMCPSV